MLPRCVHGDSPQKRLLASCLHLSIPQQSSGRANNTVGDCARQGMTNVAEHREKIRQLTLGLGSHDSGSAAARGHPRLPVRRLRLALLSERGITLALTQVLSILLA